ncbi:hypothetical protein [Bacillus anthracis]|uniref:hypothetical protein n=1 Tax=Bacillus anthracis TaxID=1392 RepID=UPI00396F3121
MKKKIKIILKQYVNLKFKKKKDLRDRKNKVSKVKSKKDTKTILKIQRKGKKKNIIRRLKNLIFKERIVLREFKKLMN